MLGVVVFWAAVAFCSASLNVENELHEIRRILIYQEEEIRELKSENRVLRADVAEMAKEIEKLKADDNGYGFGGNITGSENEEVQIRNSSVNLKTLIRNADAEVTSGKVHSDMSRLAQGPVAFYAYMSQREPNPSLNYALIFDSVKTNVGGGYNEYSGMFTAPSSGVYVFTWTIYTGDHGQTKFHVYVNHDIFDITFGETDNNQDDSDSDSGTMVVSLNFHDNVYMRSAMTCTTYVYSGNAAKSTFAGWKIISL
uniref:Uncharacterized protein LOC111107771 n=1 Tax=Crassostrea virginica TaxID=6565 RepID=A0A8B8B6S2_CRAVI|nr:uncharacterized protein LOC111107771 [Crassostrea virginica]